MSGAATGQVTARARITLLTSTACHLCEDAHDELAQRAARGELDLEVVHVDSDTGRHLVAAHRPTMFPLVLVDGQPFSSGRLSRGKLTKALAKRGAH